MRIKDNREEILNLLYGEDLIKVITYNDNDRDLFESDVPIETKVLIDLYTDSDEPALVTKLV